MLLLLRTSFQQYLENKCPFFHENFDNRYYKKMKQNVVDCFIIKVNTLSNLKRKRCDE